MAIGVTPYCQRIGTLFLEDLATEWGRWCLLVCELWETAQSLPQNCPGSSYSTTLRTTFLTCACVRERSPDWWRRFPWALPDSDARSGTGFLENFPHLACTLCTNHVRVDHIRDSCIVCMRGEGNSRGNPSPIWHQCCQTILYPVMPDSGRERSRISPTSHVH